LGRGGTGEVWLAESATGEQRAYKLAHHESGLRGLKREVALHRLIKAHHRQLTSHDPLVDWNLEVAPFFVATRFHPEGNLAEWCRAEDRLARMAIADRVALAESLCRSVAALHAADIAHRDFKPENLYPETLPDGRWRVLLGDLGVGVGFLPPGIDENGVLLGQLTRMGAEEDVRSHVSIYVAPEVLGGQPATAKSDIYALGVLTYQLVVGDLRRALAPGWHHDIENRWLREDIELAANVSPDRRAVSAEQFADRLSTLNEREQAAQRAQAEAEALTESTRRLKALRRRWRWGVALGLALAVFAAVSGGLAIKAERLRLEAQQHATEAHAVRSFLTDQLLVQADPYSGQQRDVTLKHALDLASESVESEFEGSPAMAAEVHLALAAIYEGWAEYPATLKHQQAALAHLRLEQPTSEKTAAQERRLCDYGRRASNYVLAADGCSRAAEIERHSRGELTLETMVTQAKLDFDRGRWLSAINALTNVIDASEEVAIEDTLLVEALWFRGLCLTQQGRFLQAQADFHRLLPLTAQIYGNDHPEYGWVLMDFAETLITAGDFERARPLLDTATRILTDRLGPTHADTAVPRYLQARMHLWKGDPASAAPLYERVPLRNGLSNSVSSICGLSSPRQNSHGPMRGWANRKASQPNFDPRSRQP
jgi:non-specific serine/threonine protein kinase